MRETHVFDTLNTNEPFVDYETTLSRFPRASSVGKAFREYRITKVEYIFKPLVDTFAAPGTTVIPTLYTMIDKTGSLDAFNTAEELRNCGAKPRRLDDKYLRVSFKPAVLQYARDMNGPTNLWAKPMTSPWLACDRNNDNPPPVAQIYQPSSIDHLGLAWIVDQGGEQNIQYQVEQIVHFQFKKPSYIRVLLDGEEPVKPKQV